MQLNFSSETSLLLEPIRKPILLKKDDIDSNFIQHLHTKLTQNIDLVTLSKTTKEFQLPENFIEIRITNNQKNDNEKDKQENFPVIELVFSEEKWEELAYVFLKDLGKQVETNPKSVPRSLRLFGSLMNKLTNKPMGVSKIDIPRKIVLNKAMEQFGPYVRTLLETRLNESLKS